ncbi:hypothetical protein PZ895_07805 [Mesorhizobium sp. YIM 152430]|uniref:hypothetical protein n=1 Tax=Mesorhizobium sp. YIM 152430 TaxID=3031761 RepID=UPI0023DA17E6|nr:hypothetical protein [Mesorhizobium sp. YIM 152430]MDF1599679.1 hypothetical protein [Mesorhizobium sp. YIM 152430]
MSEHEKLVVCDVWGGENSQDWVARFIRSVDVALEVARQELAAGYLVNLRAEAVFGPNSEFDNRSAVQ